MWGRLNSMSSLCFYHYLLSLSVAIYSSFDQICKVTISRHIGTLVVHKRQEQLSLDALNRVWNIADDMSILIRGDLFNDRGGREEDQDMAWQHIYHQLLPQCWSQQWWSFIETIQWNPRCLPWKNYQICFLLLFMAVNLESIAHITAWKTSQHRFVVRFVWFKSILVQNFAEISNQISDSIYLRKNLCWLVFLLLCVQLILT